MVPDICGNRASKHNSSELCALSVVTLTQTRDGGIDVTFTDHININTGQTRETAGKVITIYINCQTSTLRRSFVRRLQVRRVHTAVKPVCCSRAL